MPLPPVGAPGMTEMTKNKNCFFGHFWTPKLMATANRSEKNTDKGLLNEVLGVRRCHRAQIEGPDMPEMTKKKILLFGHFWTRN